MPSQGVSSPQTEKNVSSDNDPAIRTYCVENCKYERKEKKNGKKLDMIQCSICCRWHHNDCVWLTRDAAPVMWPCPECCCVYKEISRIRESFSGTISLLNDTLKRAHADIDRSKRELQQAHDESLALKNQIKELAENLTPLRTRITALENEIQANKWKSFRNKRSILIGDSLIRDIDEEKLVKTTIKSIAGGKVTHIAQRYSEDTLSEEPVSHIYVCIGSNDCSDEDMKPEDVITPYESMVEDMKRQVSQPSQIVLSSVPPRKDNTEHQTRVDALNDAIRDMAQRVNVTYIDNDSSFKLVDGDINDGYLLPSDNLHLTKQGTNKLARNLTLPAKLNCDDITRSWNRSRSKPKADKKQKHQRENRYQSTSYAAAEHDEQVQFRDKPAHNDRHMRSGAPKHNNRSHHGNSHHENVGHRRHDSYMSFDYESQRCSYCAEYSHCTSECGFRRPAVCRQCTAEGHKQKFCREFSASR